MVGHEAAPYDGHRDSLLEPVAAQAALAQRAGTPVDDDLDYSVPGPTEAAGGANNG
jgi:hypothetical protein